MKGENGADMAFFCVAVHSLRPHRLLYSVGKPDRRDGGEEYSFPVLVL